MSTNEQSQMSGSSLGVRGKLGLGFAALLAILIFLGGESIALLSDLGRSVDVILRENYRSVTACERMKESLERMDLEGITRLEERRQQLRIQAALPGDLIQAAADEFRSSFKRNGVQVAVENAPGLPRVLADPERVRLVLGFLVDNALANTPVGGSVTVSAEADGERVRFAVTDTGRGIPEEHQGRIFERFYQVPGSEDRGRAGLGLSIAKNLVQSHGGEIRLESQEGRGTTVWFTLPAARSEAA